MTLNGLYTRSILHCRCKDRQESCADWARVGHCTKTSGYMKMMCPESCGFCNLTKSDPSESGGCKDRYMYPSDCETWAKQGKCTDNKLWMHFNCAKSCGACTNSSRYDCNISCMELLRCCFLKMHPSTLWRHTFNEMDVNFTQVRFHVDLGWMPLRRWRQQQREALRQKCLTPVEITMVHKIVGSSPLEGCASLTDHGWRNSVGPSVDSARPRPLRCFLVRKNFFLTFAFTSRAYTPSLISLVCCFMLFIVVKHATD